jgi:hypothetical protein
MDDENSLATEFSYQENGTLTLPSLDEQDKSIRKKINSPLRPLDGLDNSSVKVNSPYRLSMDSSTARIHSPSFRLSLDTQDSSIFRMDSSSIYAQSEQIAASMMASTNRGLSPGHGDRYNIHSAITKQMSPNSDQTTAKSSRQSRDTAKLNHQKSRQANFLEVSSNPALITSLTPLSIIEKESKRLKKMGNGSRKIYSWAGATLDTDIPSPEKSHKSIDADTVVKKDPSINTSMKQWKM